MTLKTCSVCGSNDPSKCNVRLTQTDNGGIRLLCRTCRAVECRKQFENRRDERRAAIKARNARRVIELFDMNDDDAAITRLVYTIGHRNDNGMERLITLLSDRVSSLRDEEDPARLPARLSEPEH